MVETHLKRLNSLLSDEAFRFVFNQKLERYELRTTVPNEDQ